MNLNPIWLRRAAAPGAEAFAVLFALESLARAILTSVLLLQALSLLGDTEGVSFVFFLGSISGLVVSLATPLVIRHNARRFIYSGGAALLILGAVLLAFDGVPPFVIGLGCRVLGVVTLTICLDLYIMDVIAKQQLVDSEPLRMYYSAAAWTIGPALGVWLQLAIGSWLPLAICAAAAALLLTYFWLLRLVAPWLGAAPLVLASVAMVILDACGNRLYFSAVHANERASMTAVYATFRDVADLVTPGGMGLLLKLFELPAVFVLGGVAMLGLAGLARHIHPRLGRPPRLKAPPAVDRRVGLADQPATVS